VRPWPFVTALAVLQVVLSGALLRAGVPTGMTYVFTPFLDVVPGGVPVSEDEARVLAARGNAEARDIQQAYARLGSTLSLDDLVRGVEALSDGRTRLSPAQAARVAAILESARADRAALLALQSEILDREADVARKVAVLRGEPASSQAPGAPVAP
jgi:hypothetical protein